jgi:predicted AAA+ superfamily ATPase
MKNLVQLPFTHQLDAHLKAKTHLIQVIIGPRQVGKTTTLLHYLETNHHGRYHYVSADQVFHTSAGWILEQWQLATQAKRMLVIDEIQKCENWSEVIKALWDQAQRDRKKTICILAGSSSLQIQKGLTESLTGRFQLIRAHHWNARESAEGYALTFEDYLQFGGYPGAYPFIQYPKEWRDYVKNSIIGTVVEKDILQYQTVRSPALFKQAFEILIAYPAQEISYTKLLGQLQDRGNTDLIRHYIALFEGAYLFKALEKFSDKAIKRKSSSPKILPLAPCLYQLSVAGAYDPDERGHAFELAVGAQLVRTGEELFYWREGNAEVDFVLKAGKQIYAIEVKSGRGKQEAGMVQFLARFKRAKPIYITPENYLQFEEDPLGYLELHH